MERRIDRQVDEEEEEGELTQTDIFIFNKVIITIAID